MYIPWSWLKKHVAFPKDTEQQEVAKRLTALGLETEIMGGSWQFTPLPNRLDLFSWWGIAQEISILLDYPLNLPIVNQPKLSYNQEADWGKIKVNTEVCSQIQLILIQNIKIQDSPEWVKNYLVSSNIASVNNIVDLANLVMLETGQPLHAYDHDRLIDREIVVRSSQSREVITVLKGQQITLTDKDLVISAEKEIISLAGIIGSQTTAINSKTTNILIESAFFNPHLIKKTVQSLNFSTLAGQYFSKGYNLPFGNYALMRFVELIKEICPSAIEKSVIGWARDAKQEKKTVLISREFIEKKLGVKLSPERIEEILKKMRLSFQKK